MKRIIAATAFALMMGTSVSAANQATNFETYEMNQQNDIYASNFIGMRVYSSEKDYDGLSQESEVTADNTREWDDIGEVNDVILSRDGKVEAVILGVGGFIGIGEKDVAVPMEKIKIVREKDDDDDFFLVVNANKDSLTAATAYKRNQKHRADADGKNAETEQQAMNQTEKKPADENELTKTEGSQQDKQTAEKTEMKSQDSAVDTGSSEQANTEKQNIQAGQKTAADGVPSRTLLTAPNISRDGYRDAVAEELTADTLTGARVYGSNDEDVGEIDRLVISEEGKIEHAVIDVGGFLGLGEHPIAVTMDELKILRTESGNDFRVYINATQEQLETQPAYDDTMRAQATE